MNTALASSPAAYPTRMISPTRNPPWRFVHRTKNQGSAHSQRVCPSLTRSKTINRITVNNKVTRCGRASQCIDEAAHARNVTAIAINGFSQYRRTSRNNSAIVREMITMLTATTVARPPCWYNHAKQTSHSHSQANQGCPGLVYEKISA